LLRAHGDAAAAEAGYERAIAVALRQGARLWQLRATNDLSALWRTQGRAGDVRARLAPLYSTFAGAVASADLRQAKALLAETA
jgi:predicted ATPase